jgi:hypothetical protein
MASGMEWFRWHHGTVTDPKFRLIARRTGASVAEVIAVWATLLEEASMADERGGLGRIDYEALDCSLGLADGMSAHIYHAMEERDLIDARENMVSKWHKRQPKREDESAADRKRRQREREAEEKKACDNNDERVTPTNVTQCHARGEERREEVNLKTISLASVNVNQPTPTPAGVVCARLKRAGVTQVNPSNPKLLALLAQGVTDDEFADLAGEPGSKGKGFNWLLAAVAGRRRDAAVVSDLPPARASPARTETHTDRMRRVTAELTGANRNPRENPHEFDITADSQRLEG